MQPKHVPILKANKGELEALENLIDRTADKILPLFEVGRLTDAIRERKYVRTSSTPTIAYLNRVLGNIGSTWKRAAMVDGYQWPPEARTENGEHVIAYMVTHLRTLGVQVIPVIGYDRWGNLEYRHGLRSITPPEDGHYCLRLDNSAIEDSAEPDHCWEQINEIAEELSLDPGRCSVLLDFADVSMDARSIENMIQTSDDIIHQLREIGFDQFIIAGCSLPSTINLAVADRDSSGMVLRKEMLVWQALRSSLSDLTILSGDYGVRGPTTTEARSKYTNGKIRHTVQNQIFVVRGHPFTDDHSCTQMHTLSDSVVRSPHFLGQHFSWGDEQILLCSRQRALGGTSRWIAIDTNHHLTFVISEVEDFERNLTKPLVATV